MGSNVRSPQCGEIVRNAGIRGREGNLRLTQFLLPTASTSKTKTHDRGESVE